MLDFRYLGQTKRTMANGEKCDRHTSAERRKKTEANGIWQMGCNIANSMGKERSSLLAMYVEVWMHGRRERERGWRERPSEIERCRAMILKMALDEMVKTGKYQRPM